MVEFIQPVFIIGVHYIGFNIMNRFMPGHIPIELFVIGGFTTWFALSHAARGKHGKAGHIPMLSPRITPMHSYIAGAVWDGVSNLFLGFAGVLLFTFLGFQDPPPDIVLSVVVYTVATSLGFGLRLVFDALTVVFSMMKTIKVAIMWMVFFTGGIYFSASHLEGPFGDAVLWNPTLHLLEYQRHALFPGYPVATVSMLYPTCCALGFLIAGLLLTEWVKRWNHD